MYIRFVHLNVYVSVSGLTANSACETQLPCKNLIEGKTMETMTKVMVLLLLIC